MVAGLDIIARKTIPELAQRLGRGAGTNTWGKMVGGLQPEARKLLPNHFTSKQQQILADAAVTSPEKVGDIMKAVDNNDSFGILEGQRYADTIQANRTAEMRRQPQSLEPTQPENIRSNLTVSKENIAPGMEGANLEDDVLNARNYRQKGQAIQGKPSEGGLSTQSTIGQLEGQQKGFNQSAKEKALTTPRAYVEGKGLGTKIEEIPGKRGTRTEITAEIENMPYKELHHIFGKAMGAKIIDNIWRLIEAVPPKATIEDLINLNYWAKSYETGLGDFGTEAVNRISHSKTHGFSRKFGIEMSSADIKAMPIFDDVDELTSYFRELLETRVKPMRGELDLQQGAYNRLPAQMRLDVEQLNVAKKQASRDLTQSYKEIYKKIMKDTPPEVKDAYQTHKWIQEELGVTEPELIEKARKLDQARLAQDQQLDQVEEVLGGGRNKIIQLAEARQIAKEEQSEFLPGARTRAGHSEEYAANRIDPETTADRQMMEALTPKTEAERQEYIDLLSKSEGRVTIEDLVYKDSKGKWNLRKITKALRDKAKGIQPKSKKK